MPIDHIPQYGHEGHRFDGTEPRTLNEHATVPLVVYRNGQRHVVGEATVNSGEVKAVMGEDPGEEVMAMIFGDVAKHFSISYYKEDEF